jgi:hypothetical protein
MKRGSVLLWGVGLLAIGGCGLRDYERRMDETLEAMKYRQRMDQYLDPASQDPRLKDFGLYLRAPRGMSLAGQFQMADIPEGQYDLAATYFGTTNGSLHVLGRRKAAKKASSKNAPEPAAQRGKFRDDVLNLLAGVYSGGDPSQLPKPQPVTKRHHKYDRLIFTSPANNNLIQAYLLSEDSYEVALVWDTPAGMDKDATLNRARDMTLEALEVGRKALREFGGGGAGGPAAGGEATPF